MSRESIERRCGTTCMIDDGWLIGWWPDMATGQEVVEFIVHMKSLGFGTI